MAANKFATMLHQNCHKIILILVYAFLEWILILLLLLNSSFSYLITKFTNFFGLKPSCTWCSRLDHLIDSKNIPDSRFGHVCEAHGAQISKLSYCSNHKRLSESKNLCTNCSSSTINGISSSVAFFTWISEGISDKVEANRISRCSCCDEDLSTSVCSPSMILKPSWDVLDYIHKTASLSRPDLTKLKMEVEEGEDASEEPLKCDEAQKTEIVCDSNHGNPSEKSDSFEVQEWNSSASEYDESVYLADLLFQNEDYTDSDKFICIELIDTPSDSRPMEEEEKQDEEIEQSSTPSREKDDAKAPYTFPDEAKEEEYLTTETLKAKIRDQEKILKALYAELEEEREAAKETMAMISKLQEEKGAMQMEALQYQRMMEEQTEYDQEALQLLNDLMMKREKEKKELEKELQMYRNNAIEKTMMIRRTSSNASSDNSDPSIDDHETGQSTIHDVSLAEFDEERVSILEELKLLEAKLLTLHDFGGQTPFDATENQLGDEDCDEKGMINSSIMIQEELDHVYERLQSLEEDKNFLKHCISSMMKGNKGLALLQEILQHLRDLKSIELSARNIVEVPLSEASMIREDQECNLLFADELNI